MTEQATSPVERLLTVLFTPQRNEPSESAQERLDRAVVEELPVEGSLVGGGSVVVREYSWGEGEHRVLLVHGWSGHAGHMSALAESFASAGFTAVAADLPGHGRSDGGMSSVIHFAAAIQAADQRHGGFDVVIAHSLGAAAVAYAMGQGLRADRVVFINPMASYESLWRRNIEVFGVPGELMAATAKRAEEWLGIAFPQIEPAVLIREIQTRLLVIHDRHDPELALADSEALADAAPDAELVVVENLGHTRVLRNDDVIKQIVDFASV